MLLFILDQREHWFIKGKWERAPENGGSSKGGNTPHQIWRQDSRLYISTYFKVAFKADMEFPYYYLEIQI